jgi:hypothetical protein
LPYFNVDIVYDRTSKKLKNYQKKSPKRFSLFIHEEKERVASKIDEMKRKEIEKEKEKGSVLGEGGRSGGGG